MGIIARNRVLPVSGGTLFRVSGHAGDSGRLLGRLRVLREARFHPGRRLLLVNAFLDGPIYGRGKRPVGLGGFLGARGGFYPLRRRAKGRLDLAISLSANGVGTETLDCRFVMWHRPETPFVCRIEWIIAATICNTGGRSRRGRRKQRPERIRKGTDCQGKIEDRGPRAESREPNPKSREPQRLRGLGVPEMLLSLPGGLW